MPPHISRKRNAHDITTTPEPPAKRLATRKATSSTVHDEIELSGRKPRTLEENRRFLAAQDADADDDDDEDDSLSDLGSDEFEDVLPARRDGLEDGAGSEEEMDWEDAIPGQATAPQSQKTAGPTGTTGVEYTGGDISITMTADENLQYVPQEDKAGRKGPSRREKVIRSQTHCMHVQFLMWHNTMRNSWVNDKETQKILVSGLSSGLQGEVDRYRSDMGIADPKEALSTKSKGKVTASAKGKVRKQPAKPRVRDDWSADAEKLRHPAPNLSHGDPLIRLLRYLSAYWKKRFQVTAPGLRKQGYRSMKELAAFMKSFHKGPSDPSIYGERIAGIDAWREHARRYEGSRDVGSQLFTCLLRGLGIDARLVANLQPVGYGFTKIEDANKNQSKPNPTDSRLGQEVVNFSDIDEIEAKPQPKPTKPQIRQRKSDLRSISQSERGTTSNPIDLDGSSSDLSDPPDSSDAESEPSIIDVTPRKPGASRRAWDKEVPFPTYWTEVLSNATDTWVAVSALVNPVIATAPENFTNFEPRGSAADKAKLVMAYVIAYNADGSAKDVTVRYLKKHAWPGKTKGFRMAPEKIPVHNRKGKVIRYEELDWFKRVMSSYEKPVFKRTSADDVEDQRDLVPLKPIKEAKDGSGTTGEETLQGYKSSAEFVLERHLRREEAVLPDAKVVKHFVVGKGEKATREPVYRRKDVVSCKTTESWHKEGRQVKEGEQALKHVPYRAVTLLRKREIEEQQRENGEKPLQGLYSKAQTEWIIPDPIVDGKIPKNAFGNIDVYVRSMVPRGAVHVPLKGTAKLCRRLEIDHAEACTGFEFGKQRAVPVLTGVVVAAENEAIVRQAWEEEQERVRKRDADKREKLVLGLWKKMVLGLRIIQRVKRDYAVGDDVPDEVNPFTNQKKDNRAHEKEHTSRNGTKHADEPTSDIEAGGFLPEDTAAADMAGGFFPDETDNLGGGFMPDGTDDEDIASIDKPPSELQVEYHTEPVSRHRPLVVAEDHPGNQSNTPISLASSHARADKATAVDGEDEDPIGKASDGPSSRRKPRLSVIKRPKRASAAKTISNDESILKRDSGELSSAASFSSSDNDESEGYAPTKESSVRGRRSKPANSKTKASGKKVESTPETSVSTPRKMVAGARKPRKAKMVRSPYFDKQNRD